MPGSRGGVESMPSGPGTLNGMSSQSLPGAQDRQFPSLLHRIIGDGSHALSTALERRAMTDLP